MAVISDHLRARIVERHHTVTRTELLDDGVAATDLRRWLGVRALVEMHPDVYALADALVVDPFATRAAARCLADRHAVCDALASARLRGFRGVFASSRPDFVDRSSATLEVVERDDGIRVLGLGDTWFHLADHLRPVHFDAVSSRVLEHTVPITDAHAAVRRLADPRRAGHRRAAATLSRVRRWQRPPGSELERTVRTSLRRRGIAGLDGSFEIELDDGFVVHPTVVDRTARRGIEIVHRTWHGGRTSAPFDRWIEGRLRQSGWRLRRIDDAELTRDPAVALRALADWLREPSVDEPRAA